MESDDLTVRVLVEIREELRSGLHEVRNGLQDVREELRSGLSEVRHEIRNTNERLDRAEDRIVASEIRTATAITDLHGTLREVSDWLKDQRDLRDRVQRCEHEIGELKKRVS